MSELLPAATLHHSTTHPKFLHSNSTSHHWPFGAIAEIADNALDANASTFYVNVEYYEEEVETVVDLNEQSNNDEHTDLNGNGFRVEQSPSFRTIKKKIRTPYLVFQDDGTGMSGKQMHKMLSFGHCEKEATEGFDPIGQYGNGFKSGSMRLGKDALVFSNNGKTLSIGFLSQTFLAHIEASEVLVPIASWDLITGAPVTDFIRDEQLFVTHLLQDRPNRDGDQLLHSVIRKVQPLSQSQSHQSAEPQLKTVFDHHHIHIKKEGEYRKLDLTKLDISQCEMDISVILKFSPFKTIESLFNQFSRIPGKTGTHIVVFNLKKIENVQGKEEYEFIFDKDDYDIILEEPKLPVDPTERRRTVKDVDRDIPLEFSSLRAYFQVLYLAPKMQIVLRDYRVRTTRLLQTLYKPKQYIYTPLFTGAKPIPITFGLNLRNKDHFGMMLYSRNRLIKAYYRIGVQLTPDSRGYGVLGIVDTNSLRPTHNKQDFVNDNNYRLLINQLKDKIVVYWKELMTKVDSITSLWRKLATATSRGPYWIQCDNGKCLKWRKIRTPPWKLPVAEPYYCWTDEEYKSCDCPEENPESAPKQGRRRRSYKEIAEDLANQLHSTDFTSGDSGEQKNRIKKLRKKLAEALRQITKKQFSIEACYFALRKSQDNKNEALEYLRQNKYTVEQDALHNADDSEDEKIDVSDSSEEELDDDIVTANSSFIETEGEFYTSRLRSSHPAPSKRSMTIKRATKSAIPNDVEEESEEEVENSEEEGSTSNEDEAVPRKTPKVRRTARKTSKATSTSRSTSSSVESGECRNCEKLLSTLQFLCKRLSGPGENIHISMDAVLNGFFKPAEFCQQLENRYQRIIDSTNEELKHLQEKLEKQKILERHQAANNTTHTTHTATPQANVGRPITVIEISDDEDHKNSDEDSDSTKKRNTPASTSATNRPSKLIKFL